jgi:hypothetical protein
MLDGMNVKASLKLLVKDAKTCVPKCDAVCDRCVPAWRADRTGRLPQHYLLGGLYTEQRHRCVVSCSTGSILPIAGYSAALRSTIEKDVGLECVFCNDAPRWLILQQVQSRLRRLMSESLRIRLRCLCSAPYFSCGVLLYTFCLLVRLSKH